MSTNASKSRSPSLPFIAVEYGDLKAVISRNSSYQNTLTAIKKAFRSLQSVPDADIALNARFEGLDDSIRVLDDLWPELLPRSSVIAVTLDCATWPHDDQRQLPLSMESQEVPMMKVLIYRYRGLKLETGEKTMTTSVEFPTNSTVWRLAELVGLEVNTPPEKLEICYDGIYLDSDRTLTNYDIGPNSKVEAVFS